MADFAGELLYRLGSCASSSAVFIKVFFACRSSQCPCGAMVDFVPLGKYVFPLGKVSSWSLVHAGLFLSNNDRHGPQ
jgi:hypothetical protein